ncbi:hypothetical protein [Streptomyces sp. NPDC056468]|uniref:hypothetical protein n=1 Tax=unclassified Streptomyces TaxID=2593676 RepID=UPI0036BD1323
MRRQRGGVVGEVLAFGTGEPATELGYGQLDHRPFTLLCRDVEPDGAAELHRDRRRGGGPEAEHADVADEFVLVTPVSSPQQPGTKHKSNEPGESPSGSTSLPTVMRTTAVPTSARKSVPF